MQTIILKKDPEIYNQLKRLKKEVERDKVFNVARRIHAILLNMDGISAPEISKRLKVSRSQASVWIKKFSQGGSKALFEGIRSGRPPRLTFSQLNQFAEILHKGPKSCGFSEENWTCSLIQKMLVKQFKVEYHPNHIRKILHLMNFSIRDPDGQAAGKGNKSRKKQMEWENKWYPDTKKMRWLQPPGK